jgi:glycerol-3-phosphate dehydrogenase
VTTSRDTALQTISDSSITWDFLIVGGGATGLGGALEAASRGYRTLIVERLDFAKGTSSRATKLAHGGVRYLQQGNIPLVREALQERGLMIRNAPHLAHPLKFVIPAYHYWELPFYGIGLKTYEILAGKLSLGASKVLKKQDTVQFLPTVETAGLKGGIQYYDGQFDDARYAVSLLRTIEDVGGVAANYLELVALEKTGTRLSGARLRDIESGKEYGVSTRTVINAAGPFCDSIRSLADPEEPGIIAVSQGSHLVLPKEYLPGTAALMVPKTADKRVLFAIPWHERVVIGTTDFSVPKPVEEPDIQEHEVSFILTESAKYLAKDPDPSAVLACFSGLRPLVKSGQGKSTAALARDHTVLVSASGLVTITGGKWTTYRRMGQDCVDKAEAVAGFDKRPSKTESQRLRGATDNPELFRAPVHLAVYGSDRAQLETLWEGHPENAERIHERLPYLKAEVRWAARHEMARTVEDVLSRRTRALLLDARAALEAAPEVARILAEELGRDQQWIDAQVRAFNSVGQHYVPPKR